MTKRRYIVNSLLELVPITLFVIVSEVISFQTGIRILVIATLVSFFFSLSLEKRIPLFGLFAAGSIFLFGGLSIYFENPFFIIIKDTLYAGMFAIFIALSLRINRPLLEVFFKDFFAISVRGWRVLSYRWMVFFTLLALSNEIVRLFFDEAVWVIYKGVAVGVTWIFGFYQLTLTKKERLSDASPWGLRIQDTDKR